MKFWQCLAMLDMDELPTLAKHAEDLGFEGITLGEHLITFAEQYEHYDYSKNSQIRWYPETHWPEPWVQIGALSQVTTTLKFLNTLYVLPLRDPCHAAKLISTAANLCNGRLILGAGIGWQKSEFELVNQNFHNRGKRCDEMLEVMKKLWTGDSVTYDGDYYQFPALQMSPALKHELPICIGGFSEAALKRAARNDGWVGAQHEMDDIEKLIPALRHFREQAGLPWDSFDIALGLYDNSEANLERCRELGVTMLYREAFCDENGMASTMTLDEKLRDMEHFAKAHIQR
ncbi:putative F420-dependent oxidoreductase [Litorivivens lipolytica]|uniref:Putative F420-dependent oxidoreductase n=1 Tax=Litorivivens lipolytica TaxID=1524264 RepID=A0A7W4W4X7_9GAMM|nr:TIGR03619 family F420-dependent LLM class oxidoreductase [Litorivivens lipolytica]MBB3046979.1 putative F420-dependent oxidoreductase [Litorivivens lipolytica]